MSDFWDDAKVISSYTRAQAIEDGVLVDLMQPETVGAVREAGFKIPVAMTAAAFSQCVAYIGVPNLPPGQDLQGRLWDVLWMLRVAIRKVGDLSTIEYSLSVQHAPKRSWEPNEGAQGRHKRMRLTQLKAVCGPADDGSPCITIMQPHED